MKFGVPWRAKGIRADARETAKEAARRSGMSLDDWLNSVIMQQAAQAGVPPQGSQPQQQAAQPDPRALAAVNGRLDDLSRRIEQFTHTGPAAYAPQRPAQTRGPDPRAELIGRLDQYVQNARPPAGQPAPQPMAQPMRPQPPMPARQAPPPPQAHRPRQPALDQALADIAARQQMLNGGAPPPPRAAVAQAAAAPAQPPAQAQAYAPPAARAQAQQQAQQQAQEQAQAALPAHLPTQDLSGLEEQLRKITDQIETLRHPGVEEAINALRAELGEIGHALGEAMPQHSIETIERQIQGLSQRIAEGRQNGVDHGALAGIEHGLVEVRDALRGLTPAENLVGFNEAVQGLAQKIDLIVAQKDPETMAQLENAITTLRSMANHVASNDAVSALAAEVQSLADKVDYIAQASANADALSSLEHRIDALGQALAERAQNGNAVPPRLEALVQSLSDKIEQIQQAQQSHGEMAAGHLDDRIAMLVERLDASDSRIGQLEAIERGLSDVLAHIQQQPPSGGEHAPAGEAVDALKFDLAQAQDQLKDALKYDIAQSQQALKYDLAQAQDALKNDLVHSQDELKGDIARTQDALNQVHGTLGELVNRLAAIEQGIRSEPRAAAAPAAAAMPAPAPAFSEHAPFDQAHLDEEPLELTQPVGRVAVRVVDDAPGMSAFDDMLPPRGGQPIEPVQHAAPAQPLEAAPPEPAPVAPSMQPEPAPMPEPDAAAFEDQEPTHTPLPPAPQLEAQLEALRAHAAQANAAQDDAPYGEAPYDEAPYQAAPQASEAQAWAPDAQGWAPEAPQDETPRHDAPHHDAPRAWSSEAWPPEAPQAPAEARAPEAPQAPAPNVPAPKRIPAGHGPINPDLPPDQPLEPGSGPPPLRANPAARIAASEAAFGEARPAAEASAASGKSSFIAAARRAAQAAMQSEPAAAPPPSLAPELDDEFAAEADTEAHPARKSMMGRVKSLFVAASIVALVVGSVQIAATMLNLGKSNAPTKTTKQHLSMDRRADGSATVAKQADRQVATMQSPARIASTPLAMTAPTASIDLLAPPDQTVHITTVPAPDPRRAARTAAAPANDRSADITGSIPEAAASRSTLTPPPPALSHSADLPVDIGGPRLRRAAAAGDSAAAYEVAMRFAEGRGVPADLAKAARWYERAANKGLAPAQFRLASLLEKGQGVRKDLARARALYFSAARQGNAKAMHNLAVLYAEGIDGKPDYTTAVQWFRDAAKHGVSDSQYNLGILYARGIGVDKNLSESYKWFALAAKRGDKEAAKKRDEVASHMDAKALAMARRTVAQFAPAPQPQKATKVPAPPGGWDKATAMPAPRVTARSAGAFTVGKR